ncbi:unnamed protein product, partial [Effrenium voratum]
MAAEAIQQVAIHAAWHAANERSFLWESAARDRRLAEEAAQRLAQVMPSTAHAVKEMAFNAAWHTANQRRLFFRDSARDLRGLEFYSELVASLTSPELAQAIKELALCAAWHAANTRSLLWKDAARDAEAFDRKRTELAALLEPEGSEGFRTPCGSEDEAEEAGRGDNRQPETGNAARDVRKEQMVQAVSQGPGQAVGPGPSVRRSILDEATGAWQAASAKACAASFLWAASCTIAVFDVFGKLLQGFQADMRKNIRMIHQHVTTSATLEQMVDAEAAAAGSYKAACVEGSSAMGFLWLTRSLRLLERTLALLVEGPQPLARCVQQAYESTLRPHHNFFTRNLISTGLVAAPSREAFLASLSSDGEDCLEKIRLFLQYNSPIMKAAHAYLCKSGTEAKGEFHFSGPHRYFSEVALYVEAVMHDCRLSARSFCEVFVLDSDRMVHVLANSPVCAAMFIEYANEFVAKYSISAPNCHPEALLQQHIKLASQVCQNNSYYRELYVDESKLIENLNLAGLRSQVLLECAVGHHRSLSSYGSNSSPQEVLVNGHASMMKAMHKVVQKKSLESKEMAVEKVGEVHISPKEFVDEMLSPEVSMGMLVDKLRDAFVELDQAEGLHARYSDEKEQERAECGILSLICLARNDYEAFTKPQPEKARLAKAQWEQLRQLLAWTCPDNEKLLAAIFLLAVRGIGKCRPLQQQLPSQFQRPDQAVRYIIDNYPDAVPSSYSMTDRSQQLVADLLELQQNFIFAQMLQGENVPANLLQLKDFMNERSGMETLKFYVLYLLGFLSGLAGGVGSRFMTSSNAKSTLLGLSTLQHVLEKDPTALYWTYIFNRGVELQKRPVSTTDLALLRMACLVRAQNAESVDRLSGFMQQISVAEREELVKNFLADGIHSRAFVFEFLPLCFERAMKNAFVTVPRLLEVLVELLRAVRALAGPSFKGQTVPVDLSDLAAFILMVQN